MRREVLGLETALESKGDIHPQILAPRGRGWVRMSPLYLSRIKENQEPGGAPGES
jgi:hypothetical protein